MIDLSSIVHVVLYLLGAGAVFGLLFFLIDYIARRFPGEPMAMFANVAKILLVVLAVLVLIGIIISLMGGPTIINLR
jgi:hypothetical protein